MDIEKLLTEHVSRMNDINKTLTDLNQKIGGLEEQRRLAYDRGLELKGKIEALLAVKAQIAEESKTSKTAGLILPEGVKPVASETPAPVTGNEVSAAPAGNPGEAVTADAGTPQAAPKRDVVLEVK